MQNMWQFLMALKRANHILEKKNALAPTDPWELRNLLTLIGQTKDFKVEVFLPKSPQRYLSQTELGVFFVRLIRGVVFLYGISKPLESKTLSNGSSTFAGSDKSPPGLFLC